MSDQLKSSALWVAVFALVAFGGFILYLLRKIGVDETQWARIVFLHKGVEAIALAAVGFLFGKEVHRERADKAESRANAAENDTRQAHGEKQRHEQKLSDLIKFIETKREHRARSPVPGLMERVEPDSDWEDLAMFATRVARGPT